jgi:hypothetical protein
VAPPAAGSPPPTPDRRRCGIGVAVGGVVRLDRDPADLLAVADHEVAGVLPAHGLEGDTTADLPQLFGPTRTVSPAAGSITVRACDM